MLPNNPDPQVQILRRPAVQARTGLPTSTLYGLIQRGAFPKPVPIGPQAVGWISHEVSAWIEARIAERNSKSSAA